MASLETKSNKFNIVINEKAPNELEAISEMIQALNIFTFYALIIHDKDTDSNGKVKTKHLHLVCEKSSKIALKTQINELCNCLMIEKSQISIDKITNDYLPVQYLTHKNDNTKYQYEYSSIVTNDQQRLTELYNQAYRKPLNEQEITEAMKTAYTTYDLIEKIGLDNTKKYLSVFKELQKDPRQRLNEPTLLFMLETYENCITELYELILARTGVNGKLSADRILEKYNIIKT